MPLTALFGGAADVILMGPRGVEPARPLLDCPGTFDATLNREASRDRLARQLGAYLAACSSLWRGAGVDVAGYNAAEMAQDVEDLRRALGYEQISLIGVGFGSHVGMALMKENEDSIDRAAFILIQGLNQTLTLPIDVETQLERLNIRVKNDPAVNAAIPDFLGLVESVLAQLEVAPVTVTIDETDNPALAEEAPVDVTVGKLDLQYVTARDLARTEQRALPARYAEMALGDFRWLAEEALAWRSGIGGSLMPTTAQCASGASEARQGAIETQSAETLLGNAINGVWFDTCTSIGDVDLGDEFRESFQTETPVLMISGSMDALTPDANGERLLTSFLNGQHLIVDGASHDLIDEALPEIAPALVEFMLGDPATSFADLELAIPFNLTPVEVTEVTEVSGWLGEYYNNLDLSGTPALVRDDPAIDFDWGVDAPAPGITPDNFSARWTITRDLPAGAYRLSVQVDGGVRVWINDTPVLDGWEDSGPRNYVAALNLGRGTHTARVEYFAGAGNAAISLKFASADRFPDWKAEYFDTPDLSGEPVVVRNEETLNAFWGQSAPAPGVPASNWSGRWTRRANFEAGVYRFTIDVSGGVRLWLDGQLLIDSWEQLGLRQLTVDTGELSQGGHDIRVDYFKREIDGRLAVAWQPAIAIVPPQAIIRGPTRAQVGQSIVMDGSGSSAAPGREIVEYLWNWGDETTSTGIQAQHIYSATGIYNVTLRVIDDVGGVGQSTTQLRIDSEPTAPDPAAPPIAVINSPRQGIVGAALQFDAIDSRSSNPIISFAWDFGDGTTANAISVNKIYAASGTFNVTLTVTDDQGLQSADNRLIFISAPAPTATPAGAENVPTATPVIPTPAPVTPTPVPDIVTATPDPGAPIATATLVPTSPPVPEITPTPTPPGGQSPLPPGGTDPGAPPNVGAGPTALISGTVNGQPIPTQGTTEAATIVSVNALETVVLSGSGSQPGSTPIVNYQWTAPSNSYSGTEFTVQFPGTGTYQVTLTVTDANGLSDSDIWLVEVP